MQPPTIFLDFCDLGQHESKTDHWLLKILRERFDVRVTTSPDFIIYGDAGDVHRMYTCHKVYLGTAKPDFSECDFALNIGTAKWNFEKEKALDLNTTQVTGSDKQRTLDFFKKIFETEMPPVASKRRLLGRWLLVRRNSTIPL